MPERVAGIVDVTHVWTGSGSLAAIVGGAGLFDYAIASHVIEHVPNVLGWFRGIYEVLKPGAVFNLAVPDRRYTFDVVR
ncbi:methyltransferase domain-containing protein, partial [Escherichia coli]|uniref:methyltransferase domain-containing protein n=1 Tax=Escherichia coli TaxID=562 RepID=UPI0034D954B8